MQIELRQLRYFVAVAEELHFRRAAERLLLTQPALSHQIARLEHQLGMRLLERDRRSVALTPAGSKLLEGARRALHQVDQAIAAAQWTSGITSHALRLGYPSYTSRAVQCVLTAFRERHPELWLDEHRLHSQRIRTALLDRTLDVGFVNLPIGDELATMPVVPEWLTVMLPSTHPLAPRDRIPLARLADQPLLVGDAGAAPSYHAAITASCQQAGFVPTVVCADSPGPVTLEGLAHEVVRGRGLLLLLLDGVPGPVPPEIVCRRVDLPPAALKLTLAWRHDNHAATVRAFVALVEANSPVRG